MRLMIAIVRRNKQGAAVPDRACSSTWFGMWNRLRYESLQCLLRVGESLAAAIMLASARGAVLAWLDQPARASWLRCTQGESDLTRRCAIGSTGSPPAQVGQRAVARGSDLLHERRYRHRQRLLRRGADRPGLGGRAVGARLEDVVSRSAVDDPGQLDSLERVVPASDTIASVERLRLAFREGGYDMHGYDDYTPVRGRQ
jgi:hypothetical protein